MAHSGEEGFFNHATLLGLHQETKDFGHTLGRSGLNPAYLVPPIFGSSSDILLWTLRFQSWKVAFERRDGLHI
ncbi:MlaA family lipoprotein [Nitrospira sp. Ecomares 2.1]